jgi:phosphohistidine phosphatase
MKKLLLIRHAKSDWNTASRIQDIDRPLNTRGIKNSYEMAERIKNKHLVPDLIRSSIGIRALHTATIFSRVLEIDTKNIEIQNSLYHASLNEIVKTIRTIPVSVQNAFIFCHNPGINDFADYFIDDFYENVPTCGILSFNLQSDSWEDWNKETVTFDFFDYPKK